MNLGDLDVNDGTSSAPEPTNTLAVTEQSASSAPDETSQSSSETTDPKESRADLLSVVQSAIDSFGKKTPDAKSEADPADPKAESADTGTDPKAEPAPTDPTKKEPTDPTDIPAEELAKYTPNAQGRIRELIKANKDLTAQIEQFRPAVQGYDQLSTFLQTNRLSVDDANLTLEVGALLRRGDFRGFLQAVEPYVVAAKEALGEHLPDNLRQQVEEGAIPEDVARELVRTRAEASRLRGNLEETHATVQHQAQIEQVNGIRNIVASWERQVQATDPDYAQKKDLVRDYALAVVAERGSPRTPQEALSHAQEAYRRANATIAKYRPAAQPTRPSPSSVQSPTNAAPKPKSLQEAMALGLRKAAGT